MRFTRWILACLVWGMMASAMWGQSPAYTHYLLENGLASSTAYAAIQDRDGYMWFATESGANRFDGTNFETFTTADGLSGNDVLNLYQDQKGRIWFFPFCVNVCYYQNGKIHNAKTDPWLAEIKGGNFIPSFLEDSRGNMWFGDDQGRVWKLTSAGKVTEYCPEDQLYTTAYWRFYEDKNGDVMVSCNKGIVNIEKERVELDLEPSQPRFMQRTTIVGKDSILCAMGTFLTLLHGNQSYPIAGFEPVVQSEILCLRLDSKGDLWLGTRDGALCLLDFSLQADGLHYSHLRHFLPGEEITSIVIDQEGNYWMTSLTNGVFFFPSVDAISYAPISTKGGSFVNKLLLDRDNVLWVGFDHGKYGKLIENELQMFDYEVSTHGRGRTLEIYQDTDGNILMGNDELISIRSPDGLSSTSRIEAIKAIYEHPQHVYNVSTAGKLYFMSMASPRVEFFDSFFRHPGKVIPRAVEIYYTKDQRMLLGTNVGLQERKGNAFVQVPTAPTSSISDIKGTPDGVVWISTLTEGVGYLYENKFYAITQKDGLSSNICRAIAIDENGVVYVATNHGISHIKMISYPQKLFKILNFGVDVGLVSDEVRYVEVGNGKIYAATAGGLTVFDARQLIATPPPVLLHISQFMVGSTEMPMWTGRMQLGRGPQPLTVAYAGICYRNAGKLQYGYQLSRDGVVGPWVKTSSRRLEFPSLTSGSYRLTIAGYITGWPDTIGTAVLEFEILPTIWETSAFLISLVVFLMLAIVFLFWWIVRRLKQQSRRRLAVQKRIADLEHQALRSQMNPHFIFNSLNSIENFFVQDRLEEGNQFIADFSELMRAILDLSARPYIPLSDELRLVELFMGLESHRLNHRFDFAVQMEGNFSAEEVYVPPLILQPMIENAIWHGVSRLEARKGLITVTATATEATICIKIDDNGIGREKSAEMKRKYRQKHSSRGVRIIQERFDLLNADLPPDRQYLLQFHDKYDQEGGAMGTQVLIFIPFTKMPS